MKTKIVFVGINCRYSHALPSVRILHLVTQEFSMFESTFLEVTLDEPLFDLVSKIMLSSPRIVTFSVYLWNKELIKKVCEILKKAYPDIVIVLGGPEIIHHEIPFPYVDLALCGDIEVVWPQFLENYPDIKNIPYNNEIPLHRYRKIPYSSSEVLKNKLVYVETMRGCPFSCGFCVSGKKEPLREWFAIDDIPYFISELQRLESQGARVFKFLDRTFNAFPQRALEFWKSFVKLENLSFHFEICAQLLREEDYEFLKEVPPGQFQFEIGVQSLNKDTLKSIRRNVNQEDVLNHISRIQKETGVHIHADLIWGLPFENLESIKIGFNQMYEILPHELQLGFLKILPGTYVEEMAQEWDLKYMNFPPYEIISTPHLSSSSLQFLRKFESIFECFSNSEKFIYSLRLFYREFSNPFEFFEYLTYRAEEKEYFIRKWNHDEKYLFLLDLFNHIPLCKEYLRLDYILSCKSFHIPLFLKCDIPKDKLQQAQKKVKNEPIFAFLHPWIEEKEILNTQKNLIFYKVDYENKKFGNQSKLIEIEIE